MSKKSITFRWIFNSLGFILLVLIILILAFSFTIKDYYYSSIENTIIASCDTVKTLITRYGDENKNINNEIRGIIENYTKKDRIELMAIDRNSRIVMTSSGFGADNMDMPDYVQAVNSADGMGYYAGKMAGEKIMAITSVIPAASEDFSAIRFAVSLKEVDKVIFSSIILCIIVCAIVFLFVLISGLFFIKSIVLPMRRIGAAARNIAAGNFDTRLNVSADDELGELCKTINFMADELNTSAKIKNEFVSGISHELRTPLTAIKGWGETILSSGPMDTVTLSKGMRVIISETERLSQMVEELLDFSQIQDGKFTLIKSKLDILAELGEAVLIFGERAVRDGKTILYDEPEMLPYILGDKNRLKQVFVNIIDNALKYSESGDTVAIKAEESGDFIVVTIADTGCGINEEDLPFVTQKFYKGNMTKYGSGIGLAVVNEIITMHDGELAIESEIDVGTIVTIRLPIEKSADPVPQISTVEIERNEHSDE